jgi:dihydrofolate reductase
MKEIRISAIAAISAKGRALGHNNELLWHISEDLQHFKTLTSGHPIIMGRKTFESIQGYLGGPLPNRQNIVVSRSSAKLHPDVLMATSIEGAITQAKKLNPEEIFIGGGTSIYESALPYTDRLYLTLVEDEPEADSYFPSYADTFTSSVVGEPKQTKIGLQFRFVTLDRTKKAAA